MFDIEGIGPATTLTPRLAAETTVFLLLRGTPIASADDAEARPGGGPRSPTPRHRPRPGMFESEAVGAAATLARLPGTETTVFLRLIGTPIAGGDDDARPGGASPSSGRHC